MEHIVYILGAGFSAPLGLPVMANFIEHGKNLVQHESGKFAHLAEVHLLIKGLLQTYFHSDTTHLEEAFSILELRQRLEGDASVLTAHQYIRDVIKRYSPAFNFSQEGLNASNWHKHLFATHPPDSDLRKRQYSYFVSALFGLRFQRKDGTAEVNMIRRSHQRNPANDNRYSVITFNYDTVLEDIASGLSTAYPGNAVVSFTQDSTTDMDSVSLIKLHGSIDSEIMLPTWNKTLGEENLGRWRAAHALLSSANQIRIIGYSMPQSDNYLSYMLKSAGEKVSNLKRIDVLCLDKIPEEPVRARYKEFIAFKGLRYKNSMVELYLGNMYNRFQDTNAGVSEVDCNTLESQHEMFFVP